MSDASRRLDLKRFARRRAEFIDAMDLDALGVAMACAVRGDDEAIDFEIASGHAYLAYLIAMEDLRARIDADG